MVSIVGKQPITKMHVVDYATNHEKKENQTNFKRVWLYLILQEGLLNVYLPCFYLHFGLKITLFFYSVDIF